jgi:hypothetical protein
MCVYVCSHAAIVNVVFSSNTNVCDVKAHVVCLHESCTHTPYRMSTAWKLIMNWAQDCFGWRESSGRQQEQYVGISVLNNWHHCLHSTPACNGICNYNLFRL